ncbi:tetratricopeptide repeat protein [Denitratisoma oestradiolicum]|uniref:Uncharacterized protein n=1 Tax=Denitratisoma oestradiolicum TaxID=311182 RepID=A0A6S6XSC5_9PROT|nr:tetratricopeptide repeat protein [Denitratisoma oestradiolicum]TWO80539.1 hypothetical protein CBW56_08860 [Denitratisoma oestradiolicum]CAB1367610.1 conserved protein of unknown function [Denitratisoma oestradiolicum]
MSLLNQMLRDLDRRDAPATDRDDLASYVRVLSGGPVASRWREVALLLAGLLAGGVVVWLVLRGPSFRFPAPAPVRSALPVPAAPPPVAAIPHAVEPAPAVAPVITKEAPPPITSLKIDPDLDAGALPVRPVTPPRPVSPAPAPPQVREGTPPPTTRPPPPVAESQSQIDKTSRTPKVSEVADGEYRKALGLVRRGSLSEAVDVLRRALNLDSRHAQARQALLSVLLEQKQWREALGVANDGLALDPTQSGWAMIAARLLVEQGDVPRAVDLLATHGPHAERNADYQAFHGLLLQRLQRPREAAQRYQAALALHPAEGRWWYGLGLALDADRRETEARDAYRKARDSGTLSPDLAALVEQKLR